MIDRAQKRHSHTQIEEKKNGTKQVETTVEIWKINKCAALFFHSNAHGLVLITRCFFFFFLSFLFVNFERVKPLIPISLSSQHERQTHTERETKKEWNIITSLLTLTVCFVCNYASVSVVASC